MFSIRKALSITASIILAAIAAMVSGCGTTAVTYPLNNLPEGTLYRDGRVVADPTFLPPDEDHVSYWDGDGVAGSPSVTIDLSDQKAYFFKGDSLVGVSRISTGREGYDTPTGQFKISQKSKDHRSNLYGDYVDAAGNKVVKDVDVRTDPKPAGTRFLGASMPYFMRFNGGVGMHAGFLPGYPASHGCIRMPERMAMIYFNNVTNGTPVKVVQ